MIIGIVGTGLIGGSMAVDLKKEGFADCILGVEKDPLHAEVAKNLGIIDEVASLEDCARRCNIIIVAIPVGSAVKVIPQILDMVGEGQIVTDVCSSKGVIANIVKYHPKRRQFVSAHPMAGTEYSGPWAAMPGLFAGRSGIICDSEESDMKALDTIQKMYRTLNMHLLFMSSAQQDVHTAYVSHISHITSFALALTVLEKEKNESHIFDLASGGFSSTVRLAKSNADMWVPILMQNRDNILTVIDTYMNKMMDFRNAIAERDEARIEHLICGANRIKRIIR